jgi:myo-inositol 2-dehydrogenase/D-chiro-inositol 1-dehydrogenase
MTRLIELCSGLGQIEQITIDQLQSDRSREAVLGRFANDIDLARVLAGDLTHVSALAVGAEETRYANLGVQLSGPREIAVRWTIQAGEQQPGCRLNLQAAGGRAELWMPEEGDWRMQTRIGEQPHEERFAPWDPAAEAWSRFQRLMAGESVAPNWVDCCRAVELTETIDRSLKKGRTIELHYEDYSEQGTFKGTMTSLGCGLLFAALVIMVLAALAGNLVRWFPFLQPLPRHWATILLALFGLFLALQSLRLVFAKPDQ